MIFNTHTITEYADNPDFVKMGKSIIAKPDSFKPSEYSPVQTTFPNNDILVGEYKHYTSMLKKLIASGEIKTGGYFTKKILKSNKQRITKKIIGS